MKRRLVLPHLFAILIFASILWLPVGTQRLTHADRNSAGALSDEATATLSSLEKVDDYPLYTMRYYGAYQQVSSSLGGPAALTSVARSDTREALSAPAWACTLFVALGDTRNRLYGRNFDWEYSPALLLFTQPPDGYPSVSMVDIAYLGFAGDSARTLLDLPLLERQALLDAPYLPFDGMNAYGLAVAMAAVPPGQMRPDPRKATIGSLGVIRKILDHARTVDEAVEMLKRYNIDMTGGPPLHYLIADPSGHAALVEFYQGEMIVLANEKPWQVATNFLRSSVKGSAAGQCWRYDTVSQRLTDAEGRVTMQEAGDLLATVSQPGTQWSIVYGMSTGDVTVTMGKQYDKASHHFHLSLVDLVVLHSGG
jgi:hypothetical protein